MINTFNPVIPNDFSERLRTAEQCEARLGSVPARAAKPGSGCEPMELPVGNSEDELAPGTHLDDDGDARLDGAVEEACEPRTQTVLQTEPAPVTAPRSNMVPIASIQVGARLRPLSEDHVERLRKSIAQIGLQQPISVAEATPGEEPAFQLIAGHHRLEACKRSGFAKVPAIVVTLDDDARRLWEIDENLFRAPLTELERGEHLVERKQIYERLHPGAAHGGDHRSADFKRKKLPFKSFAADTAEQTGFDSRTIRLLIERAHKIDPGVKERIRLRREIADKGVELDALKSLSFDDQLRAVQMFENGECKSIRKARQIIKYGSTEGLDNTKNDEAPGLMETAILDKKFDAAMASPREQAIINNIHKILDTLDDTCRANVVSNISNLGNMPATDLAKYLT
jgi:ParB family transcriptional regulator, chromosome partitioning protein